MCSSDLKESEIITKGTRPNYWNAENWNSRATRNRHLKKFEETISKHSSKLKEEIRAKINRKIGKLIDVETKATYEPNFSVLVNGNEKIDFLIPTYSKRDTENNKNETNVAVDKNDKRFTSVNLEERTYPTGGESLNKQNAPTKRACNTYTPA